MAILDLGKVLSKRLSISREDANTIIETMFDIIIREGLNRNKVRVWKMGSFRMRFFGRDRHILFKQSKFCQHRINDNNEGIRDEIVF